VAAAEGGIVTRRAAAFRFVTALLLTACAVVLIMLARDAWHWGRAMTDADARAGAGPISTNAWNADTVLPDNFVRDVLGIHDDVAYRQAVMGAIDLIQHRGGTGKQQVLVETALAHVVLSDRNAARASDAADYLGVLLYDDLSAPQQAISPYVNPKSPAAPSESQTPEQKALAEFETAVRLDPENANAKKNLELMLSQSTPQSQKGTPKPGSGGRLGSKGSGQGPAGYGY
jgi:hypothetical protein